MLGLYMCARKHRIPGYNIIYNDIVDYEGIDLCCDCLNINLEPYDFIIATPPCNYYSRANYRRQTSEVAQRTKHILPKLIEKLSQLNKPFIIENVCNSSLLPKSKLFEFEFGQHHFYTNVFMLIPHNSYAIRQNKQYISRNKRDGNYNVDLVIKYFLEAIHENIN